MCRIFCVFILFSTTILSQEIHPNLVCLNKKEINPNNYWPYTDTTNYDISTYDLRSFTGVVYLHCSLSESHDTLCRACFQEHRLTSILYVDYSSDQSMILSDTVYMSDSYTYYINGTIDMETKKYSNGRYEEKIYAANTGSSQPQYLLRKWYSNGQKESEYCSAEFNKKIGPDRSWYENGHQRRELYYNNSGELNGLCNWWNEYGVLLTQINYKDGKRDGVCTWWDKNGNIDSKILYDDGNVLEVIK